MKISNRKENKIQPSIYHLLYSLARTGESSGEHIRTMAGIMPGQWLWIHQDRRLHESLFSTRWKIRKLLGTIIKGGIDEDGKRKPNENT